MTEPQARRRLTRTASPDTSDAALAEIEERVRRLRETGDPRRNVATLEYLITVARERPAERREAVRLVLHELDNVMP